MLVEFRVKNFRSIRDEQVLSMVASAETGLEDNIVQVGKLKLNKVAAIYGANASGKSNIIDAMVSFIQIVLYSTADDSLALRKFMIKPFLLDKDTMSGPSSFEVTFIHKGIKYQYGLEADSEKILKEWLYASPKGHVQSWFERDYDESIGCMESMSYKFGSFLKGDKAGLRNKTKQHVPFLSVAAQWNHDQLSPVYNWFKDHLRSILPGDSNINDVTLKMLDYRDDKGKTPFQEAIEEMIRSADFGIQSLSIKKTKISEEKLRHVEAGGLNRHMMLRIVKEGGDVFLNDVFMHHLSDEVDLEMSLPLYEESLGTQRLFRLAGPWLVALKWGMTIFVDELDASMHPLMSRKLIQLMLDPAINKKGGQLIFTSHDTTLLDPELLRRDQIWFTEKDEKGGTQLYSLWDYAEGKKRPRKDEALQRGYLSGRYGAVPFLEAFGIEEIKKA